jgi:hypothetical protein
MPEGVDSKTLHERGRALLAAIAEHGFSYSDRLHIHLFGGVRGA